jgi:hypothetical protein
MKISNFIFEFVPPNLQIVATWMLLKLAILLVSFPWAILVSMIPKIVQYMMEEGDFRNLGDKKLVEKKFLESNHSIFLDDGVSIDIS